MAAAKELNIIQKLSKARIDFLKANVKKTGKNRGLSFMYYTLEDIVPTGTQILDSYGLMMKMTVNQYKTIPGTDTPDVIQEARAEIIDGEGHTIEFTVPFVMPSPILNKEGNAVNNPVQDLGSSITYLRRYLWLLALDITEHDTYDEVSGEPVVDVKTGEVVKEPTKEAVKKPTRKAAPTKKEKEEIKKEVVNTDELATDLVITSIKKGLKKITESDKPNIPFVKQVLKVLNDNEGKITTKQADEILIEIGKELEG